MMTIKEQVAQIILAVKLEYSPGGIVDDARADSSGSPPNMSEVTRAQYRQAIRYLPQLSQVIAGTTPVMAQGQYNAAAQTSPQYAALDLALKNQYGVPTADANAAIASRNTSNLSDIFSGAGSDLIRSSTETAKIADPEYYRSREQLGAGVDKLLSGQDPNRLTEAELENATRGVNRTNIATGNVTPSQTQTISNAMTFGDELSKKRALFGDALGRATGALPAMKSGADTFRQVTGQPGTSGLGDTNFGVQKQGESGAVNNALSTLYGAGSSASSNYINNSDYRSDAERVTGVGNGVAQSMPDY